MARIRTVKPEFWTSGQVLECSPMTRLFFIGLWNFADDAGRHPYSVRQAKAEVFPGDDISSENILGMLQELEANGLIKPYTVDGKEYFQITGWHHQRIDKPQPARYPGPDESDSENVPRTLPPERKGKEGIGEEGIGKDLPPDGGGELPPADSPKQPPVPYQEIVGAWNRICGGAGLRTVEAITDKRKASIRARARDPEAALPTMEHWEWLFTRVAESRFLTGRVNGTNGRPPFQADLDWVLRPTNCIAIAEGKYS